jgi:BirA family biotin operon repressor/biotin-[acetyl-CoA-carboxylase] ligase
MNSLTHSVLMHLADGQFHSGTALGKRAGRTRTAVWKAVQSLQQNGLPIYSVRGKGYRLAEPIELLDGPLILSVLDEIEGVGKAAHYLQRLDVFHNIESTNAYLLNHAKNGGHTVRACLAELQTAGRGRRGRRWISPFGGNLYLSLLWHFDSGASQLGGLSLAVAVAVMRTLRNIGLSTAGVKWPNDILIKGQKLAGILLEISGEAAGPCAVVIGIGLNVRSSGSLRADVDQAWTDLESELGRTVSRNHLVAQLLGQLINAVREFEAQGLQAFVKEWSAHDVFSDREVTLLLPQGKVNGIARGIDENGALMVVTKDGVQRYHSGEVSLRAKVLEPEEAE